MSLLVCKYEVLLQNALNFDAAPRLKQRILETMTFQFVVFHGYALLE